MPWRSARTGPSDVCCTCSASPLRVDVSVPPPAGDVRDVEPPLAAASWLPDPPAHDVKTRAPAMDRAARVVLRVRFRTEVFTS
jgi:hypothetical protein